MGIPGGEAFNSVVAALFFLADQTVIYVHLDSVCVGTLVPVVCCGLSSVHLRDSVGHASGGR